MYIAFVMVFHIPTEKVRLVTIFFFLLFAGNSLPARSPHGMETRGQTEEGQAVKRFVEFNISCLDLENCPDFAGVLAFPIKEIKEGVLSHRTGVCSQTLIASDRILTNGHCLPEGFFKTDFSCEDIIVAFPKTKQSPYESVTCQSVLDWKDDPNEKVTLDWAILQLSRPVKRKPVVVDISGVPDKTLLRAFPFYLESIENLEVGTNAIKSSVKGSIGKNSCHSYMDIFNSVYYNHPQSPLLNLFCDNDVIPGNSGTGLISREGKLSGIAGMNLDSGRIYFMGSIHELSNYRRLMAGMNAHCISPFNGNTSPACAFDAASIQMHSIGFFASNTYGLTPDEKLIDELEASFAKDKTIQWEDHNENFISRIYSKNEAFNGEPLFPSSSVILDTVLPPSLKMRFLKTPFCIHSSRKAEEPFDLIIPYLSPSLAVLEINDENNGFWGDDSLSLAALKISAKGRFETPLKLSFLRFEMKYDKDHDQFSGELHQIDDDELKTLVNQLINQKKMGFSTCLPSPFKIHCLELYVALQQIEDLKSSNVVVRDLFANEEFIREGGRTNQITLPVCQ